MQNHHEPDAIRPNSLPAPEGEERAFAAQPILRLAHISDIHCYRLTLSPLQFLSKRWLGNLNCLFNRRLSFSKDPNSGLIELFARQGVDHVMVSGDLSTTSLSSEFYTVSCFLQRLRQEGMGVHVVPGNHDAYTAHAVRNKTFYRFFENEEEGDLSLRKDRVSCRHLGENWWWIGLDTTIFNPLFSSKGRFCSQVEENLTRALEQLPADAKVVLVNHFPLFESIHSSHDMERAADLRNLLRLDPRVRFYLHGHIHRQRIRDMRMAGLPLLLNSGSCGFRRRPTCHIVEVGHNHCLIKVYVYRDGPDGIGEWELDTSYPFLWEAE